MAFTRSISGWGRFFIGAAVLGITVVGSGVAMAQRPLGGGFGGTHTTFRPGGYHYAGGGMHRNPVTGSHYVPGVGVAKGSGIYTPAGNGYYQNQITGNVYNPNTGSYTQGKNLHFRPGGYNHVGAGIHHNPVTGSAYLPNVGVAKPSGIYTPMGNGYYRNPATGNVYNPNTGAYKSRW